MNFEILENTYRNELIDKVIPFWLQNSLDNKYGGYFSCLDNKGKVYDTDKFIWLQCRQMWMFSFLYQHVNQNSEYLKAADIGERFLKKFGHDGNYNWFFSVDRKGNPLIQPYNIFSNAFAALAFGQYGLIKKDSSSKEIAKKTFSRILDREKNPKGVYNKVFPGTRSLRNFSLPMILSNLSFEVGYLLDSSLSKSIQERVINDIMKNFYYPEKGLILENINDDGSFSDTFEGRLINPGHTIEAMWFLLEIAEKRNDSKLISEAEEIILNTLEFGWDKEYGGIFYFLDVLNKPLQNLEWNQKLWWVHIETLIALIKAYQLTNNEKCLTWFKIIHDYTWKNFRDEKDGGEWFGYLNRDGSRLLNLKGGKWKGCFHIPRGLYKIWNIISKINKAKNI